LRFGASINLEIWHMWCQNGDTLSPGNRGVFSAPEKGDILKNSGFPQFVKMEPF